jgi:hypothetical protein
VSAAAGAAAALAAADPPWLSPISLVWVGRILAGHQLAFGRPLLAGLHGAAGDGAARRATQELFAAATVVLAHDGGADPRFVFANRAALVLWRRRWAEMVGLPSRFSAAAAERDERAGALARALQGAIRDYAGVRVDSRGRRFRIEAARLWTLQDERGEPCGQAAAFNRWWWL